MKTRILDATEPGVINAAMAVLQRGGLVAFPTDTVYGVGALVMDQDAILRIYAVKERQRDKPIPVLLGKATDLDQVALKINAAARRLAAQFWPGPLTLVMPRHPSLPQALGSEATVGVRVPAHPVALDLLRGAGPMAVTSANLSGQPSACDADAVFRDLAGRIELLLDGGTTLGQQPSTVVDCSQDQVQILRRGPISQAQIHAALDAQ